MNNVQHFRHWPQPRSIPLDHLLLSSSACGICCCASSSLLLSSSSSSSYNDRLLLQNVLDVLQLTISMALTMFLCGASSYANIEHTFLAALILSSLIAMDLSFDNLQQQQQQQSQQAMQTMETITTMARVLDILWRILPSSLILMRMTASHDGWVCQIQGHCTVANHNSKSNFTLVRLRMASPMMASTYNIGICHLGGPWEFLVSLNPASNCQLHCTTITLHELDSRQRLAQRTSKRKQNLNPDQEVSIHISGVYACGKSSPRCILEEIGTCSKKTISAKLHSIHCNEITCSFLPKLFALFSPSFLLNAVCVCVCLCVTHHR